MYLKRGFSGVKSKSSVNMFPYIYVYTYMHTYICICIYMYVPQAGVLRGEVKELCVTEFERQRNNHVVVDCDGWLQVCIYVCLMFERDILCVDVYVCKREREKQPRS